MIYTFRFDQAAVTLIGEALGEMPHKKVGVLVGNIQAQINQQLKEQHEAGVKAQAEQRAGEAISRAAAAAVAVAKANASEAKGPEAAAGGSKRSRKAK